jgi:hypothetical protein
MEIAFNLLSLNFNFPPSGPGGNELRYGLRQPFAPLYLPGIFGPQPSPQVRRFRRLNIMRLEFLTGGLSNFLHIINHRWSYCPAF